MTPHNWNYATVVKFNPSLQLPWKHGCGSGKISVTTTDTLTLSGKADKYQSGIYSLASDTASGNAGLIALSVGKLTVQDEAQINAGTYGNGLVAIFWIHSAIAIIQSRQKYRTQSRYG
ncbi:MAG: hypothetical protein R3E08_00470 [Thiotrichaceae bacterium]